MSGQTDARPGHLAGGEHGIPLPALFTAILDALQDHDGRTVADLVGPVATALPKRDRLAELYGPADPFGDVVRDALDCLERQGVAERREQGVWRTGEKFATGRRLPVVPGRKATVTVYPAAERDRRNLAEQRRMTVQGLAARLRPDGPGLRPLDEGHVESLAESMRAWGWLKGSTVLVDQHGRVLAGRHRIEAAKRAGIEPVIQNIKTGSDEESVGYALAANQQRAWTTKDRARLDDELRVGGLTAETFTQHLSTAAKRRLIEERLRDDPARSDALIAEGICTDKIVAEVRAAMEVTSEIPRLQKTIGSDGKWRTYKRKEKRRPGAPTARQRVHDYLADGNTGTPSEIADATKLNMSTVAARLDEEKKAGLAANEDGRWRRAEPAPPPAPDVEREARAPAVPATPRPEPETGEPEPTSQDSTAIPEDRRRRVRELLEAIFELPAEDRQMLMMMWKMSDAD